MIVVDASALTNALTNDGPLGDAARAELADDLQWTAPEHLLIEVFSSIRGQWLGQQISRSRAQESVTALGQTVVELVANAPLLPRMWELRDNISGYDAAYIALAEALSCPLVTADARLARAPGLWCEIRLALAGDRDL